MVLTLITWLRWCFSGFSTIKFLFFSLLQCPLWKEVTLCSLHLRGGKLCSIFFRGVYPHKLLEILLQRIFFSSLAFVYWLNYSFIFLKTHGYLFYTLDYSPMLCYLFCCLNCSNFCHWELMKSGIRNQHLGTGCTHCYWGIINFCIFQKFSPI